jgi:hypothetical protein
MVIDEKNIVAMAEMIYNIFEADTETVPIGIRTPHNIL